MNAPSKVKMKRCRVCREPFMPRLTTQPCCYKYECQVTYATAHALKSQEKRVKADRKETRAKLMAMKPISYYRKHAQDAFNRFIRLRDEGKPCISCGRTHVEWTRGGEWDCGHFLSVGSHPELRFEESNAHRQCKSCNGGSGKYARKGYTVAKEYEERLIERIGQDAVDWLKGPHEAKHYGKEEFLAIKAKYKTLCRELEQQLTKGD
jgi:hypothetical protein